MLQIQLTKKLADQLNEKLSKEQLIDVNPLYAWHAHIFIYKRRKYIMVMNNKSRYNFIIGSLVKKNFQRCDELVIEAIAENLLADGFEQQTVQTYKAECDTVQFAPTNDRRIISQMNEMILVTKQIWNQEELETKDINLHEQNRFNNKFVMLQLPETYSAEAMAEALKEIDDKT